MTSKPADAVEALNPTLDDYFRKWGLAYNLDWRLIKAHAVVESGLSADAVNPSDPSYGVMQILCSGAHGDETCENKFFIDDWSEASPNRLLDADFNIRMGAQIIKKNLQQYGWPRAVAVYNRFAEYKSPMNGPFANQDYVDRVLSVYTQLGGGTP